MDLRKPASKPKSTPLNFAKTDNDASLFDIAIRLGRVEQMLAENRAMLTGGAR